MERAVLRDDGRRVRIRPGELIGCQAQTLENNLGDAKALGFCRCVVEDLLERCDIRSVRHDLP